MNLVKEIEKVQKTGHPIGNLKVIQGDCQRGRYHGLSIFNDDKTRELQIRFLEKNKTIEMFFFNPSDNLCFSLSQLAEEKSIELPQKYDRFSNPNDLKEALELAQNIIENHMASIWSGKEWYEPSTALVEKDIKSHYF